MLHKQLLDLHIQQFLNHEATASLTSSNISAMCKTFVVCVFHDLTCDLTFQMSDVMKHIHIFIFNCIELNN